MVLLSTIFKLIIFVPGKKRRSSHHFIYRPVHFVYLHSCPHRCLMSTLVQVDFLSALVHVRSLDGRGGAVFAGKEGFK